MLENTFIQHSFLAIVLGFIIGIQREMRNYTAGTKDFGGSRTFAIISLIGYLSAFLSGFSSYFLMAAFLSVAAMLIAANVASCLNEKQRGTTTEFSAFAAFLLGALLNYIDVKFVIFCAVALLLLLNLKDKIQELEKYIGKEDLNAAVLFLTMTFIVLPVLPDKAIDDFGLFVPYNVWLMVVLIAGISFAGYIAVRVFGTGKGIVLTGLLGGLVSSTAVTISLSRKAAASEKASQKVAVGIMLASTVMLARALLLVFLFNKALLVELVYAFVAAFVASIAVAVYFYFKSKQDSFESVNVEYKNPFELKEALILGLFFGIVIALVKLSKEFIGDSGIYAVSFISGITDVDAIILSLSEIAGSAIDLQVASYGIAIAVVTNNISKLMICYFIGTRELAKVVGIYYLAACATLAALVF
ncbi:MAG: MgtC/SapB family protein [Campylobacterales bacterium]